MSKLHCPGLISPNFILCGFDGKKESAQVTQYFNLPPVLSGTKQGLTNCFKSVLQFPLSFSPKLKKKSYYSG
jgi:hypothetical protein